MNIEFDSFADFYSSLEEVEVLIESAEANADDERKYVTYNKSAVLLLAGKFENFVESLAEEYIYFVNSFNLRVDYIPQPLRLQHTIKILRKLENFRQSNNVDEILAHITELGSLWGSQQNFGTLSVECKFSYGKHGGKELEKLFANIGIQNIFEQVKVYRIQETLLADNTKLEVDVKTIFNSVTNIRNNILHQDATPNLTIESIKEYKLTLQDFAKALALHLKDELITISQYSNHLI